MTLKHLFRKLLFGNLAYDQRRRRMQIIILVLVVGVACALTVAALILLRAK